MVLRVDRAVRSHFVAAVLVGVLLAAACYEGAVALGWLHLGKAPGEGPPGQGLVLVAALAALVVAAGLAAVAPRRPLVPLLAPAAAALVVARFYTYDPYYLPTLRRMSDGGAVAGRWVAFVCAAAAVAALTSRVRPRTGSFLTVAVLILCFGTVVFEGAGH
jgi:general stress protein CsbA